MGFRSAVTLLNSSSTALQSSLELLTGALRQNSVQVALILHNGAVPLLQGLQVGYHLQVHAFADKV